MAPLPPAGIVAPEAPMIAGVEPVPGPKPPRQPRMHGDDISMEERLERLERMVQSLMAQKGQWQGRTELRLKERADMDGKMDQKDIERNEQLPSARQSLRSSRPKLRIAYSFPTPWDQKLLRNFRPA